jgi:hypothetical protein
MSIQTDPNQVIVGNNHFLDLSRGVIRSASAFHKFGANTSVGTGGEMVADLGGSPIFPTTASSISISSASQEDTASGAGIATVVVEGLDENGEQMRETIAIDASIAAVSTGSFLRVFRMFGATLGSAGVAGGTNVGAITATIGGSNIAQISVATGQTLMAWFTTPRKTAGYITRTYASLLRAPAATVRADFQLFVSPSGGVRRIRSKWGQQNDGSTFVFRSWEPPERIDPLTDIYLHCIPSAESDVSGGFSVICIRED